MQVGSGTDLRRMMAYFVGGNLYANTYVGTTGVSTLLASNLITTNTTYIVEVEATSTGSTVRVYVKGQTPAQGWSYSLAAAWTQAQTVLYTYQNPGYTTSAVTSVDNLAEYTLGSPAVTAADRLTRQVYDSNGRLAYSIDALGEVTGYTYDNANRLVDTTQSANRINTASLPDVATPQLIASLLAAVNGGFSDSFSDGSLSP
jgi:YD repeat-containing protein